MIYGATRTPMQLNMFGMTESYEVKLIWKMNSAISVIMDLFCLNTLYDTWDYLDYYAISSWFFPLKIRNDITDIFATRPPVMKNWIGVKFNDTKADMAIMQAVNESQMKLLTETPM